MNWVRLPPLLTLALTLCSGPAGAQATTQGCTLVMQPTGRTESVSLRISEESDAYITHVWGGMRWTCGTATMTADSAVRYDIDRRVEMFGSVRYRDTIRTMNSDRLDFFEDDDRMIARQEVVLTRLASGSTLRGPHVTFLRAVSGIAERTTATGRPHMILLPEPGKEGKPVDVDADRVDMFGERLAWAWGDVVIERSDVYAEADSAFFDMDAGNGVLYGNAFARQADIELEGDSIRLSFTEDELKEVRALGSGRALGEEFEILSEEIRARLVASELDEVWAFGSGRSLATSASYVLGADSLRIGATAGRLDSIVAVGQGSAVEVEAPDLSLGEPARTTGGGNWVIGDTLIIIFAEEGTGPPGLEDAGAPGLAGVEEPPASPEDSTGKQTIERLLAIGDARSLYQVEGESDPSGPPSRNYLIGEQIDVEFREGKARRVSAVRAIGVYLEPGAPGAGVVDPELETDPSTVPATQTDSIPSATADTLPPAQPDSVSPAVADSVPAVPTDSVPAVPSEGADA
ncbi:MAG: hypothetical protein P8Y10_01295 [Gemmatimonadales bacterium]